jgi:cysteine-rich repeat protein
MTLARALPRALAHAAPTWECRSACRFGKARDWQVPSENDSEINMTIVKSILFASLLVIPFVSCTGGTSTNGIDRASEGDGEGEASCAFTQGYWKNHPDAWPVASITLGSTQYTKAQLLDIFDEPVRGNGLLALAHQLIAAKLNAANGSDDHDIADDITACDTLIGALVVPPVGSGSLQPGATSALTHVLDVFNNTGECEPDGGPEPVCGNGIVEDGEQCDDGESNSADGPCHLDCTLCPDTTPGCGNGVLEAGEECDDGNLTDGDGCSSACKRQIL